MKNGAPMNDNTIPTGISEGMAITLDIKSQSTIKSAPRSADVGIRYGIWSPTRSLARCGTIIPINPIKPAKLTDAPARIEANIKNRKR